MGRTNNFFSGGIRRKIFGMLLITIILIIAAYTAVYLFQSARVEQLVSDIYEEQEQVYIDNGLEDQVAGIEDRTVSAFHREMFHARNILILSVAAIVAAGMAFAASITNRIIDPLNTITRRVASLGVRNRQFQMEDIYKTGDEIEVLAESFAKLSARTVLYIEQIKHVTSEKERIGAELDMAKRIQASQLPQDFDDFCGGKNFSLHAYMRPAREVGGDFYDFFMIDDDHVVRQGGPGRAADDDLPRADQDASAKRENAGRGALFRQQPDLRQKRIGFLRHRVGRVDRAFHGQGRRGQCRARAPGAPPRRRAVRAGQIPPLAPPRHHGGHAL